MISPDGLLDHARRLAGTGRGRPFDVDLRRGVSAAYYSTFHEMTDLAARHLIGSASEPDRNRIRRTWKHGELSGVATELIARADALASNPEAPLPKDLRPTGPLADIAARDGDLVEALRLFKDLQKQRHRADYDHDARFDKLTLLTACSKAERSRKHLNEASKASREAMFAMLTVRRSDFSER